MLIPVNQLPITKPVKGILHVGAHECEERLSYMNEFGLSDQNMVWVEALPEKVDFIRSRFPSVRVFQQCVSDVDDHEVSFMVASNGQSSSMLNFKTHSIEHPHVIETRREVMQTKTLNTLFAEQNLDGNTFNFWNFDIQGAELMALKGATRLLPFVDYIYTEVNTNELYEGCALLPQLDEFLASHGFQRVMINMTVHGWGDAFYKRVN